MTQLTIKLHDEDCKDCEYCGAHFETNKDVKLYCNLHQCWTNLWGRGRCLDNLREDQAAHNARLEARHA